MTIEILLADDDAGLRKVLTFKLQKQGFKVTAVADGAEALEALKEHRFDLILSDMKMPRVTGLELLQEARRIQPDIEVILITAFAEVPQAVQAVKAGAVDYLTKPFEDEQLFIAIDKAVQFKRLQSENRELREQLKKQRRTNNLVGISASFKQMMELVDKIAPSDATVLLTGESGSGKEVFARAIHNRSARAKSSFTAVNCAAIPRDLVESELFGHVKGAFTGAVKDKKGKFVLADGGTLFLDEISELNVELQAKLLRAIQERVIEPVGSEEKIEIDIRLLAATNVDLSGRVKDGSFREDLFYRLNVIPLEVPPLRKRIDDIPILVKEFAGRFGGHDNITFDKDLVQSLQTYHWPGNIRELENLVERMVVLRKSDTLTAEDLPQEFVNGTISAAPVDGNSHQTLREAEKQMILNALRECDGNKSKTAAYLDIPRHVLVYRMKKYGIF